MPRNTRALARATRTRMAAADCNYTQARADVQQIHWLADENDWTFDEAQDWYDNPANKVMCETCGWTYGMVCPECPGCGCYNGECSGWRHHEYAADDGDEPRYCFDCGGELDSPYGCSCDEEAEWAQAE